MLPDVLEQQNVSLVGYHSLNDRPAFKMGLQVVDGSWYMYFAHFWDSGWTTLNITDPEDPQWENFTSGPTNTTTKQIQVADGKMITALERPGNAPHSITDPDLPSEAGAFIWDIETDPTDPKFLGHYDEADGRGTHRNFYNGGDYAYMCTSKAEFEPVISRNYFLTIVDISDPTQPKEVSSWMWPGQHPDDDEEPAHRHLHGPAYVDGDDAYLSYGRAGLVKLDISDKTNPEAVFKMGFGESLGSHNGVHSFIPVPGTDLAIANSEAVKEASPLEAEGNALQYSFVLDLSDDRDPGFDGRDQHGARVVSSFPMPTPQSHVPYDNYFEKPGRFGPHNQHHPRGEDTRLNQSELIFMTYFNAGLRIFDISDPLFPQEVGHAVPSAPDKRISNSRPNTGLVSQLEDVVVDSRGYIYCTDPQQGVFIFKSNLLD